MDYQLFEVETTTENIEPLITLFAELSFDGFEEKESGFSAYIPIDNTKLDVVVSKLAKLEHFYDFSYATEIVKYQNWNAIWEAGFQPIIVDDFCGIRADFHDTIEGVKHELVINPKMAFGTGHHETTHMMIQTMEQLDFDDKTVFDYGCGTGILAILASKLKAKSIVAVDIESESYLNTLENSDINKIENIVVVEGTLDSIEPNRFGIILANINRNVILASLASLKKYLSKDGQLIISGFLKDDEDKMLKAVVDNGYLIKNKLQRNNWLCWQLEMS